MSHFLRAPCSFIVLNLNLKCYIFFLLEKTTSHHMHRLQSVGLALPQPVRCVTRAPAIITFLLGVLCFFLVFFLYILAAVLVVEYTIIWIISTSVFIYLLLALNHSLLFPLPPLFACRMYCM